MLSPDLQNRCGWVRPPLPASCTHMDERTDYPFSRTRHSTAFTACRHSHAACRVGIFKGRWVVEEALSVRAGKRADAIEHAHR